jgi:hypothetical protein
MIKFTPIFVLGGIALSSSHADVNKQNAKPEHAANNSISERKQIIYDFEQFDPMSEQPTSDGTKVIVPWNIDLTPTKADTLNQVIRQVIQTLVK